MRCASCGGRFEKQHIPLRLKDVFVGELFIGENVEWYKCCNCDEILYPFETAHIISKKRKEKEYELLMKLPIGDFMSAVETAKELRITRQALHKSRRIRKGFIFQATFGGKPAYLKKSVMRYKQKGDGRFSLVQDESRDKYDYPHTSKTPTISSVPVSKHAHMVNYIRPSLKDDTLQKGYPYV